MSTTSELRKGWFRYALTQCRDNSTVAMTDDEITAEWGLVRAERIAELERENARLREALKPFVEKAGDYRHEDPQHHGIVLISDLRRAAALAGSGEK